MTLTEAHDFIRKLRQPPFDDADSDYDFVRMWERRHYLISAVLFVAAATLASLGFDSASDAVWVLLTLAFAADQALRCQRFRRVRRLFEDRAPQSFRELERPGE